MQFLFGECCVSFKVLPLFEKKSAAELSYLSLSQKTPNRFTSKDDRCPFFKKCVKLLCLCPNKLPVYDLEWSLNGPIENSSRSGH